MKIKLLFAFLLVSFFAVAQPTNYQNIAARYRWMAGYFTDGFHVPGYSTVPNLRTGVWPGAGNIGLDTVAHKFYFYSGGTWREVAPAIDSLIYSTRAWRQKGDDSLGALKADKATTLTINGTTYDLSANRSWTVSGSATTFTQGLTESGGIAKIDNKRNIEYITQPTSGAALSSGWTAVGSPSYTVSNGQFVFSGGANNRTQYIKADAGVLSEGAYIEAYVICNTIGATDHGPEIGWKSYNANGYVQSVSGGFITGASATGANKAIVYGSNPGSSNYSDSTRSVNDGDTLYYRLTRNGDAYKMLVENLTKDWKLNKIVQTSPFNDLPFVPHNSSYVSVYPGAGSYTVYGLKYVIEAPLVTELMIIGNSITMGQKATSDISRWAARVGNPANNIISGGGADATGEVLARINEVIAIKPKSVLLMIGGNDIVFATATATWKANYLGIRDSCVNNGIEVIHALPTPRTGLDVSALKYYIDTSGTFRSDKIIDTWAALLGTGTDMAAKYNSGDGTHPNDAGMSQIAATVNEALKLPNGDNFLVNKNLVAGNGSILGVDNGVGSDQFWSGALLARKVNSTSKGIQMGYVDNYGYLQAFTSGSTYDPIVLAPITNGKVGIRETAPTHPLDVKVLGPGNGLLLNNSNGWSANGEQVTMDFGSSHVVTSRVAMVLHNGGYFGLNFYTGVSGVGLRTNPVLFLSGLDSMATFSGKLRVGIIPTAASADSVLTWDRADSIFKLVPQTGGGSGSGITMIGISPYGLIKVNDSTYRIDTSQVSSVELTQKKIDSLAAAVGISNSITSQFASAQAARFWVRGIARSDSAFKGTTTGAYSSFQTGGLIAYGAGSATSYLQAGYDQAGGYGWIQSTIDGSSYQNTIISPAGTSMVGIKETAPSATLDVKNAGSGADAEVLNLNYAAGVTTGKETRLNFQYAHLSVARIASYFISGGDFGLKVYTGSTSAVNATPAITINKDNKIGLNTTTLDSSLHNPGSLHQAGNAKFDAKIHAPNLLSGNGSKNLRWDATNGIVLKDTAIIFSYTASLTNTTNIAASTAYAANFTVVGDWYHVWGEVDIDATAATTISEMSMTLPVSTSFANTRDLAGTASFEDNTTVQIKGDVSNGTAKWRFTPQTDTNNKYSFHFSFKYSTP